MPSRSASTLTLALLVALQLLLQPLAAMPSCSIAGLLGVGDCCCAVDDHVEEERGCCSQDEPEPEPAERIGAADECPCIAAPETTPLDPAPAPERHDVETSPLGWSFTEAPPWAGTAPRRAPPPEGTRAPGARPPLRLLTREFRL